MDVEVFDGMVCHALVKKVTEDEEVGDRTHNTSVVSLRKQEASELCHQ